MTFARRVLIAAAVTASVVLILLFFWGASDLLMLVFAGVLVSILLRGFTRLLTEHTPLGRGWALVCVSLALMGSIAAVVWLIAGRVGSQASELQKQLPHSIEQVKRYLEQYQWGQDVLASVPSPSEWMSERSGNILARFTGIASATIGAIVNAVLLSIIGIYLASQPDLYSRGLRKLLPIRYRERAGEVLGAIDEALWRWLIGRFSLMLLNAILTGLGLWLLGVQFAFTMGLVAGLLNFIPNFGPWIAAIPAVLVGLLDSPMQALYVTVLYLVLQGLDGYVLTPLVDRRSVALPPVVTITAQVLLGASFGFMGMLLASPLTAAVMIAVRMLYVEDVLGDADG